MTRALDSGDNQSKAAPTRTCVGCRTKAEKSSLIRVTDQSGVAQPDPRARHDGRGAYVHLTVACVEQAIRRRALTRALRTSAGLDYSALRLLIAQSGTTQTPNV